MSVALRLVAIVALVCGVAGVALVVVAQPAPLPQAIAAPPLPTLQPSRAMPTAVAGLRLRVLPLLPSPTPSATVAASATPEATATQPPPPSATATPFPQIALASFPLSASDMRYNIEVALNANGGALRRVVIAPGATFSFNAALGPHPTRLRWRLVGRNLPTPTALRSFVPQAPARLVAFQEHTPTPPALDSPFTIVTVAPVEPAAPEATPAPALTAESTTAPPLPTAPPDVKPVLVLGGGVCDLASRFVVAGRQLLPSRAFRFRQHPGGVAGVKRSDAVSIWATGGGPEDNDLLITNTSPYYLVFETHVDRRLLTVLAWFQNGP